LSGIDLDVEKVAWKAVRMEIELVYQMVDLLVHKWGIEKD